MQERATHPEPRGQRCSPILFFVIAGVILALFIAFLVAHPHHEPLKEKILPGPGAALNMK